MSGEEMSNVRAIPMAEVTDEGLTERREAVIRLKRECEKEAETLRREIVAEEEKIVERREAWLQESPDGGKRQVIAGHMVAGEEVVKTMQLQREDRLARAGRYAMRIARLETEMRSRDMYIMNTPDEEDEDLSV